MIVKATIKYQTLFCDYISNCIAIVEGKVGREYPSIRSAHCISAVQLPSPFLGWSSDKPQNLQQ
jgi:hypothetical protein